MNENYHEINVASQEADPNSVLNHFRKMTQIRNENLVLVYGDYDMILDDHEQIYAYTRTLNEDKMLILLNFTDQKVQTHLPETLKLGETKINNYADDPFQDNKSILMEPYQALVVQLDAK